METITPIPQIYYPRALPMSFREIQEFSLIVPNFLAFEELAELLNFRINNTLFSLPGGEAHV